MICQGAARNEPSDKGTVGGKGRRGRGPNGPKALTRSARREPGEAIIGNLRSDAIGRLDLSEGRVHDRRLVIVDVPLTGM
jgi:hypothetical protein